MLDIAKIYLKKNEERRILTGHPWVYSNEIDNKRSPLKDFSAGDLVQFWASKDKFVGAGYINPQALIAGRILSRDLAQSIDKDFFTVKIKTALKLRESLYKEPYYRLVFGESDGLPGLIIDRYNEVFVLQTNTAGMDKLQGIICEVLLDLFRVQNITLKNDSSMRRMENLPEEVKTVYGEPVSSTLMIENDCHFQIPVLEGQKTGWFYDHRENRRRLQKYVNEKSVLDVFAYVGGWGVQAARNGAKNVLCIDSSEKALNYVQLNSRENHVEDNVTILQANAFDALKNLSNENKRFDVVILDPPALIKKRKDIEQGSIAYLRLNESAMSLIDRGILVSCSCSLHMPLEKLIDTIRRAAIKTKKVVQILEIGFQGMDHPIDPAIPETAYLKAIFCLVQ